MLFVSIHAPARGATLSRHLLAGSHGCFNPRPRAGGDRRSLSSASSSTSFNPRPRAGGDHCKWFVLLDYRLFQSTPPRGGRPHVRGGAAGVVSVSIHAPARGATLGCDLSHNAPECFNPRPRAGGDDFEKFVPHHIIPFQSTPPRGGRPSTSGHGRPWPTFQSTPPRGGRHGPPQFFLHFPGFNPRPRAGGDPGSPGMRPQISCFNPRPRAGGDRCGKRFSARR